MTRSSSFIYRMRLTRHVGPGRSVQMICSPTPLHIHPHGRNDTACHIPSAGVPSQATLLARDLRGLLPMRVQDTTHCQSLHHPPISLRSLQHHIHQITTPLLFLVYRATPPPKRNVKVRPFGAESARRPVCGKGRWL